MPKTSQPIPQSPFPLHKKQVQLSLLLLVLALAIILLLLAIFTEKKRGEEAVFDAQAKATGIMAPNALEAIYARSGEILEIGGDYYIIQSESVLNDQRYEQRYKIMVTDTTTFTDRIYSLESTDRNEVGMTRSALTVGDIVRASTNQNIVGLDVFTAQNIERYTYQDYSSS